MAGKSGSLLGLRHIAAYLAPYYHRVWDMLRERGTRVFQQDSDGNVMSVLPALLDAGITASLPIESSAGMDMVEVRQRFGMRLALYGGLDKFALRGAPGDECRRAIDAELAAKLPPLRHQPGLVFGLDHRIPPGTPLAAYRYYVDTAREMLGLPPRRASGGQWMRMAF